MAEALAAKVTIYLAGTKIVLASFTVAQALVVGALAGGGVALAKRQESQAKAKLGLFREQELNPLFDARAPMMAVLGETRVSGVYEWFNAINSRDAGDDFTPDIHDVVFRQLLAYSPKETATIEGLWIGDEYYAFPSQFTALAGPQEGEYPFSYQARRPESRNAGTNYGGRANEKRAGWNCYLQTGYGRSTMLESESANSKAYYDLPVDSNAFATGALWVAVRFRYTQGNQTVMQPGGNIPVSAKVKERHYDPRKDSSRTVANSGFAGNGTQRLNDPTTWEPSNNPIVQWLHYKFLLQAKPLAETRIDWKNLVIPAMNVCDGDVPIPGAPGATEKRYQSSVAVYLGDVSDRVNIDTILATCGGREVRSSGKWGVLVPPTPAQIVPVTTLTKGDFVGDITLSSKRDSRYGSISGEFTAPDKDYVQTGFPARKDAAEITRRGFDKNLEIQLRGVTSHTQAQRVANSLLKRSNAEQESVTGPVNWKALELQCGAAVNLDWPEVYPTPKLFAVQELVLNARNSPLTVVLLEVNRAAHNDMAAADYHTYDADGNLVPRLPTIPAVTALSATSQQSGILLKWKYPENWIDPQRARIYASRTAAWNDAALVAETPADSFLHTLAGGETRWYWVRNHTDGQESVRTPNDDVSSVTATAGGYAIVGDLDAHGCPPLVGVQGSVFYGRNGTGFFQRGPDFFDGPASAVVGLLWRKLAQAFTVNQTAFTLTAAAVASSGDNGHVESITFKGSADRTALTQITAVVAGDAADDANSIAFRDGNGNLASQPLEPLTATTAGNKTTYTGDLTGSALALVSNIADVSSGPVNLKSATRVRIVVDEVLPASWFVAPFDAGMRLRQLNIYANGSFALLVGASGATGDQDELTDRIERDIRIAIRNRTTGVVLDVPGPNAAVTQSKDAEGNFYRFTPDADTAAKLTAEFNATSLNTQYDVLAYDSAALTMALGLAETDKRCSGNVANPWVPELSAAAGVDGVGVEDIYAWYSSDTLPASKQPDNAWGYDSGGTSDGLVWSDAAGEGSKTNPWLHKWSRATEGTPAAGDPVDGQWYSNFIARVYGEKGDAGDKGDTDLEVTLYQKITSGPVSSYPAKPTGALYNFDTQTFSNVGSWQRSFPSYDEYTETVVCTHVHFSGSGTAYNIPNSRWSTVIACNVDHVLDRIFKKSATPLTAAPANSTTRKPATWHNTIAEAKAAVSGDHPTYSVFQVRDPATGVWARQVPVAIEGEKGDKGNTDLEVTLYQTITSGSAFPAKPTNVSYNFDTGVFTGLGSWQRTFNNNYDEHTQTVVCSHGHFSGSGTAFTIPNSRWSAVIACSHDFVADYIFKESATVITTAPADSTTQVPDTWHGTVSAAKAAVSGENQLYKIFQIRNPVTGVWARQAPVPVQGEKGDAGITASQDGPVEFTGRGTNWTPSGYQYVTAQWSQDAIEKFSVRIQYRVSQASQTDTEAGNIQSGTRQYRVNRGNWQTWTSNPAGVTKSILSVGSPHASWIVAWKGVEVALRAYSVKDGADGTGADGALPYFRGNWASGVDYNAGDVVTYPRTWEIELPPPAEDTSITVQGIFKCRVAHRSSSSNQPNRSGAANTNWELYFGQFTSTPGAPTNPRTSGVTSSGLTFAWNAPSQAVTNYVLQWKTDTAQPWGTEYTTTSTSYAVPSLSPNTRYNLRVKARHTLDGVNYDSDYATVDVTTTSATPSGFTVSVSNDVHSRGAGRGWNVDAIVTATGGTTPYTYVFSGSPISQSSNVAIYRITAAGTYNESVTVTDGAGVAVTKQFSFVVS